MLLARAVELLRSHRSRWLEGLRVPVDAVRFVRGFAEGLAVPFATMTAHAPALAERFPLLTNLELTVDSPRDRVELARPSHLELLVRARRLGVKGKRAGHVRYGHGPTGDLRGLTELPFTQLRRLRLEALRVRPAMLGALLASPALETLEELEISLALDGDGLEDWLARASTTRLRKLSLANNPLGDRGASLLARAPMLHHLTDLDLRGAGLTARGRAAILAARPASLLRVHFDDDPVDGAAVTG